MKTSKFFYFTIKGDDLDVIKLKETVSLPCNVYLKGEKQLLNIAHKEVKQKTNRWVYSAISIDDSNVNKFLKEQLLIIISEFDIIKEYSSQNKTAMELTIYGKYHIKISKSIIRMLNTINQELQITFY